MYSGEVTKLAALSSQQIMLTQYPQHAVKQQNLIGENVATDYTPLPADSGCIDMSSFFGNWEGKTRSLVVNAGFKCEFYT